MYNRLHTELFNLVSNLVSYPREHYKLTLKNNSYLEGLLEFKGPDNTQYAGGNFKVTISIPQTYEVIPPSVRFDTLIYHINVDPQTGDFSPNLINSQWTQTSTIEWLIDSVINIVGNPWPDYYVNHDVCLSYYNDNQAYVSLGRQWTAYYSPNNDPINVYPQHTPQDLHLVNSFNNIEGEELNQRPQEKQESIKTEENIHIDNKYFACVKCGFGEIELILPGCRHTYHLKCFENFCDTCNTQVEINPVPAKLQKNEGCRYCDSLDNLLPCYTCNLNTCFMCISLKILPDCCEQSYLKLEAYKSQCPACFDELSYKDFLPIKCRQHPLICKKCLSLSISIKNCILGCKIPTSLNDNINCQICMKYNKPFYSDYKCQNYCKVCEICQWSTMLRNNHGVVSDCLGCNNPLVR